MLVTQRMDDLFLRTMEDLNYKQGRAAFVGRPFGPILAAARGESRDRCIGVALTDRVIACPGEKRGRRTKIYGVHSKVNTATVKSSGRTRYSKRPATSCSHRPR
ncbi:hypothetical protein KM043_011982 [Ampulex compressa]|nr:hypothetical protein KM043_011982 [Ampulex compressa]